MIWKYHVEETIKYFYNPSSKQSKDDKKGKYFIEDKLNQTTTFRQEKDCSETSLPALIESNSPITSRHSIEITDTVKESINSKHIQLPPVQNIFTNQFQVR